MNEGEYVCEELNPHPKISPSENPRIYNIMREFGI